MTATENTSPPVTEEDSPLAEGKNPGRHRLWPTLVGVLLVIGALVALFLITFNWTNSLLQDDDAATEEQPVRQIATTTAQTGRTGTGGANTTSTQVGIGDAKTITTEATAPSATAVAEDDVLPLVIDDVTIAEWRAERPEHPGYWLGDGEAGLGFYSEMDVIYGLRTAIISGVYRGIDVNGNWVFDIGDHPVTGEMVIGRFKPDATISVYTMSGIGHIKDNVGAGLAGDDELVEFISKEEASDMLVVGRQYPLEVEVREADCQLLSEAGVYTKSELSSCQAYVDEHEENLIYNNALLGALRDGGEIHQEGAGQIHELAIPFEFFVGKDYWSDD